VCAALLGDDHLGPADLRVHHPDLEDALIALIAATGPPDGHSDRADVRFLEGVS
jgi:hypothetical protein